MSSLESRILCATLALVTVAIVALLIFVLALSRPVKKTKTSKAKKSRASNMSQMSSINQEQPLSCPQKCCLLCCPPCPGAIANKLAFIPPKPSTYTIQEQANGKRLIKLSSRANWMFGRRELTSIEVFFVTTSQNNRVACMFVRGPAGKCKYTMLYSHGNASDLGQMASFYYHLAQKTSVNVLSYDYSGYGESSGTPTETNMYGDIEAVLQACEGPLGVPRNRIILYGQSIGSAPTVYLASQMQVAGVVLQSAFTSALRIVLSCNCCCWYCCCCCCCDSFKNLSKASSISSPVLVIHGTRDEVVDIEHGIELYKACPRTVEACWVHKAGHNDIIIYDEYYSRLRGFQVELDRIEAGTLNI